MKAAIAGRAGRQGPDGRAADRDSATADSSSTANELARYGLNADDVNEFIETAMNGRVVSEIVQGQRKFDLVVRLDEPYPRGPAIAASGCRSNLPGGRTRCRLIDVADVVDASGPNTINRENVRRRIVVQCNTAGRDLASVVADIQQRLAPDPGDAADRLLHRVRRPVREPAERPRG